MTNKACEVNCEKISAVETGSHPSIAKYSSNSANYKTLSLAEILVGKLIVTVISSQTYNKKYEGIHGHLGEMSEYKRSICRPAHKEIPPMWLNSPASMWNSTITEGTRQSSGSGTYSG